MLVSLLLCCAIHLRSCFPCSNRTQPAESERAWKMEVMDQTRSKSQTADHGTTETISRKLVRDPAELYYWTWGCCFCLRSSGMHTSNNPQCAECSHYRCPTCYVKKHSYSKEKHTEASPLSLGNFEPALHEGPAVTHTPSSTSVISSWPPS